MSQGASERDTSRYTVEREVVADDGVRLYAEVDGDPDAPVTIVLCHGFVLDHTSWRYQRAAMTGSARVVCWDQRGHGRSGHSEGSVTIDQLGRDLYAVLDQLVPEGPVVLAGHSMGGMTIMALAAEHPELFAERVHGVALIATSAGPVGPRLTPALGAALYQLSGWVTPLARQLWRMPACRQAVRLLTRRFAFGSNVAEPLVDLLVAMLEATSLKVMAGVLPQFGIHDKRTALAALGQVTTLVLVGDRDLVTPPRHSSAIVDELPGADLVVVPDAGHAVILERPLVVSEWLLTVLAPVRPDQAA